MKNILLRKTKKLKLRVIPLLMSVCGYIIFSFSLWFLNIYAIFLGIIIMGLGFIIQEGPEHIEVIG